VRARFAPLPSCFSRFSTISPPGERRACRPTSPGAGPGDSGPASRRASVGTGSERFPLGGGRTWSGDRPPTAGRLIRWATQSSGRGWLRAVQALCASDKQFKLQGAVPERRAAPRKAGNSSAGAPTGIPGAHGSTCRARGFPEDACRPPLAGLTSSVGDKIAALTGGTWRLSASLCGDAERWRVRSCTQQVHAAAR